MVDVVQEEVEGPDALLQAPLDEVPLEGVIRRGTRSKGMIFSTPSGPWLTANVMPRDWKE